MMRDHSRKRLSWGDFSNRKVLIKTLQQGSVVVSSTDTIYGFLGDAASQSYEEICSLKQVANLRPFLILISSPKKLFHFVDSSTIPLDITRFLDFCWPGPVTVICRAKPGLPQFLLSDAGTIALRCPNHEGLLEILPEFDGLFSTSANLSGQTPPQKLFDIDPEILDAVPYVVVDEESFDQEDKVSPSKTLPSSIIDISSLDYSAKTQAESGVPFRVVREGVYSKEKLKEIYEKSKQSTGGFNPL